MKKVLIIGPFPNPISGVSLANEVVRQTLEDSELFRTDVINSSYPVFQDSIGSFSLKKFFFYLKVNSHVFKIFKTDLVYITPGQTFFGVLKYSLFILMAAFFNKELIIHVHGNFLGKQYALLKGLKKKIFYFLVSRFTKGIVLSASLKSNLTPFIREDRIFVLNNFAQDFLYEDSKKEVTEELRIIFLSNLMEEKGIFVLLEALQSLEDRNIKYSAKIAGNIDDLHKDKILLKIASLQNTVYIGVVAGQEKKDLLQWSSIFVLPTYYQMEGQPISIIEALATQNVVISTNHAGIPDMLKTKVNGFIVDVKCSESLLIAFLFLNDNKHKIKEISIYNKQYFLNNFTIKIFKKNLIKILNATT